MRCDRGSLQAGVPAQRAGGVKVSGGEKQRLSIARALARRPHTGDVRDDGTRTVFFEMNGQPHEVNVVDRAVEGVLQPMPKADADNANPVAAPMPGKGSTVAVKKGQAVQAGERLLSIAAMKMETAIYSPRDTTVKDILVGPGSTVDAHDLLLLLEG